MKKKASSLSPTIEALVDRGEHLKLLCYREGRIVQTVEFQNAFVRESFNSASYQIMLSDKIMNGEELICLFPNHREDSRQVIRPKSFYRLSSLNKAINASFASSLEQTEEGGNVKFAVCYGNHVLICKGITGTIYLCWASHICRVNSGNVANTAFRNVPCILNLDGQMRFKALYILKPDIRDESDLERIPITSRNPKLLFESSASLFVCEVRRQKPQEGIFITTVSRERALKAVTATTKDHAIVMQRVTNQFEESVDNEEIGYATDDGNGGGLTASFGSDPDMGTPREVIHVPPVRLLASTPPILRSDGEVERDPFDNGNKKDKEENIV